MLDVRRSMARMRSPTALALAALLSAGCGAGPAATVPPAIATEPAAPLATPATPPGPDWGALHVPLRSVTELSVMSFNIRNGDSPDGENHWDRRRALVFAVIADRAPDVVLVQEATLAQIDALLEALPAYGALGVGRTDGRTDGEIVAILFRMERLEALDRGVFWLSEQPSQPGSTSWGAAYPRACTWAVFRDRRDGQTFAAYDVHLDHRSARARAEGLATIARHIRDHAEGLRVIVAGDLNLGPDDPALERFLAETRLVDAYREVHRERADDEATYHGFRGDPAGQRIDFILVSPEMRARAAEIVRTRSEDGRYPSDHYPITTTLRLSRAE